ncbi:hypothetical protein ACFFIS_02740 [Virgibacillus soli]|uniref:LysM domain-containing protein n=1 Tax=Paracerasibacillus soli TaxID=480284 RepID=A0ABU5CQ24_9BACI|nr:hypothetical protein [Virgibacillus soli]MDY0408454.1 hypothetical protein [Virgibacillus soli]
MDFLKRLCTYALIILFVISIYYDLTVTNKVPTIDNSTIPNNNVESFHVKKVKVSRGDTLLSVVEQINQGISGHLNMEEIIMDFKTSNPNIDPYKLEVGKYYYFPIYED